MIIPIVTLYERVKKMKVNLDGLPLEYRARVINENINNDFDHILKELVAIRDEVDEWRSQAIIMGFKDEYDHIAEEVLGRPFSEGEWEFSVKDNVENDSSLLQSTGDAIAEYAYDIANEILLESEEE